MWTKGLLVLVLTLVLGKSCSAKKGLFIMATGTKSHFIFYKSVVEALAKSGHEMTLVSPYEAKFEGANVTKILLHNDYLNKILGNAFESSFFKFLKTMSAEIPEFCTNAMTDPEVKKLVTEHYDYIMLPLYFTDCFLSYVHERQVPLIYVTPNILMNPQARRVGALEFPGISPSVFTSFTYPMSLWQRVLSTLADIFMDQMMHTAEVRTESLCRELQLWSPDTPSMFDLQRRANLTIINSVRALENPVKLAPPSVVYAGGIHIKPTKPLPKDLQDWLDGSGESGFILFSLGSAVRPAHMRKEHLQSFLGVFRSLKQRIIWSWSSEDIENLPPNVKISPWLPQQDILAHPKIRLFITHGGLFSTLEATYFGVPVIGLPVYGDQASNVAKIVKDGWGRQVMWNELNEKKLRDVVMETLTNTSLRRVLEHRSKLMNDWLSSPSQEVVHWVDYILRHNGAVHLQSPFIYLPWYRIYNVDVWIVIVSCLLLIFALVACVIKTCFKWSVRKCFRKRKTE